SELGPREAGVSVCSRTLLRSRSANGSSPVLPPIGALTSVFTTVTVTTHGLSTPYDHRATDRLLPGPRGRQAGGNRGAPGIRSANPRLSGRSIAGRRGGSRGLQRVQRGPLAGHRNVSPGELFSDVGLSTCLERREAARTRSFPQTRAAIDDQRVVCDSTGG